MQKRKKFKCRIVLSIKQSAFPYTNINVDRFEILVRIIDYFETDSNNISLSMLKSVWRPINSDSNLLLEWQKYLLYATKG